MFSLNRELQMKAEKFIQQIKANFEIGLYALVKG